MTHVEWDDVQGLVLRGYSGLRYSDFILWQFAGPVSAATRSWLHGLAKRLTRAASGEVTEAEAERRSGRIASRAINLALTCRGVRALLGTADADPLPLSREFADGMAPPSAQAGTIARRSYILGDLEDNAPAQWRWGGPQNAAIDGVLMLYAPTRQALDDLVKAETLAMSGVTTRVGPYRATSDDPLTAWIDGPPLREHFGFRDGISQPTIEGRRRTRKLSAKEQRSSVIKTGEFVLGYPNERGATVTNDLARNGTYLVMRQLEQHVEAFNAYLGNAAQQVFKSDKPENREWVAARLIGRHRSGAPLVSAPADARGPDEARNDFLYHFEDRFGMACPIGAHIRRANPRDSLGPDPDTALRLSKMHRIIRRSRLYGQRLADAGDTQRDGAAKPADSDVKAERGLFFMCLNADIAGQFEMIQHSWINNIHFGSGYDEADPISHYRTGGSMTIPTRPANLRLKNMPRFVTVRGGAYFFMPGIKALERLIGSPA